MLRGTYKTQDDESSRLMDKGYCQTFILVIARASPEKLYLWREHSLDMALPFPDGCTTTISG